MGMKPLVFFLTTLSLGSALIFVGVEVCLASVFCTFPSTPLTCFPILCGEAFPFYVGAALLIAFAVISYNRGRRRKRIIAS